MSMDLLRRIASNRLPKLITTSEDIDKVGILRAAGLVIAFAPHCPILELSPAPSELHKC